MKHNNLVHFKGYEELISRIEDWTYDLSYKGVIYTPFLLENEQQVVERYLGNNYYISKNGGYDDAQKCVMKICDNEYYSDDFPIVILEGSFNPNYAHITHRDCLGAILSLGVEPSVIGDIIVDSGKINIIVHQQIAPFIKEHLLKIKHTKIAFHECEQIIDFEQQFETWESVVSSRRLDVIVATCIKQSRSKAKKIIEDGRVKVNHELLEDISYLCNNCCVISIRKFGRYKVEITDRTTKKNNLVIIVSKYL